MTSIHLRAGQRARARKARAISALAALPATVLALALTACTLEVQNTRPARELAAEAQPPGSLYLGWRVFNDQCARCHGAAATGGNGAPNLLAMMSSLGPRRFASLVLMRYDLDDPSDAAARRREDAAAREARVNDVLQRRDRPLTMPAWQGEPRVNAHILDLYAYLAARAEGRQGTGRPAP
jgi:hypothetical protein